ncbi:MAG TPA: hypothetical protein VIE15_04645, partial [Acidimicrobiales bacterium]
MIEFRSIAGGIVASVTHDAPRFAVARTIEAPPTVRSTATHVAGVGHETLLLDAGVGGLDETTVHAGFAAPAGAGAASATIGTIAESAR